MCLSTWKAMKKPWRSQLARSGKRLSARPCLQIGRHVFKLLFYGSSTMAPFKPSNLDLRGTRCTRISVGVSFFFFRLLFLYCTFKPESIAKRGGEWGGGEGTDREDMSDVCYQPLIKTFVKSDNLSPASPRCCYSSHVQIKLHCRTDDGKP